MTAFVQMLTGQLPVAAVYALVGVGFVLIYRTTKTLNIAQGVLALLGAYVSYTAANQAGLSFAVAVILGLLAPFVLSVVVYRILMRPLVGQPPIVVIIMTLALLSGLEAAYPMIWGPGPNYVGIPAWFKASVHWGPYFDLKRLSLVLVIVAIVLIGGFGIAFRFTRFGLSMRASAEDAVLASARGVNITVTGAFAWGLAGALAAIAAIEYGATQGLTASTADVLGFGAFPAIILGGIDSVAGVLVGAVILAEAEGLSVLYVGGQFSEIVGYLILLAVLLVRPRGLFGSKEVVRL